MSNNDAGQVGSLLEHSIDPPRQLKPMIRSDVGTRHIGKLLGLDLRIFLDLGHQCQHFIDAFLDVVATESSWLTLLSRNGAAGRNNHYAGQFRLGRGETCSQHQPRNSRVSQHSTYSV